MEHLPHGEENYKHEELAFGNQPRLTAGFYLASIPQVAEAKFPDYAFRIGGLHNTRTAGTFILTSL